MRFNFSFYSSILLIFFVHTTVYGILFLIKYKKQQQQSALWMGLFLLLSSLYIAPWMLGFAGWYSKQPYRDILFYVPFQHLFLFGPIVFFYVSSLLNPQFKLNKKMKWHFMPAVLYLLFSIVIVVYDKLIVGKYYFLENQEDPDFSTVYQIGGFVSMIFYFIASLKYYQKYKTTIESLMSNTAAFLFGWIRNFLIAFLVILVAWLCVAVFGLFFEVKFTFSWWYFLGFAICCYYIAIAGYSNSVEAKLFFKSTFFSQKERFILKPISTGLLPRPPEDYEEIELTEEEIPVTNEFAEWKTKLEALMQKEQSYLNPDLSLFDLAKSLSTNVSFLSKVINQSFQLNFNDWVNKYRIEAFIELVKAGAHKTNTILSLAYDSGFNSKPTFNRAFKKITGITPQQFIKKHSL